MNRKAVEVLDCTLRDGSYAINFKFTAADTAVISRRLEAVGIRLIEVGHGIGMGASEAGLGQAVETDEGYLRAAADALTTAKFGMFCIPGIAKLEHIDLAAEYGMGFIRIGTNVTEVENAEPFIVRAKDHGMFVSANLMKSYASPPDVFAQKAILTQKYGADILCVVDSAGGMLADEVESYFSAVRDVCNIALGFHGHDNLGLAVGHSLRAVELGATIVDSTLQGLGRSAGNAPTERLVAALMRMGHNVEVDLFGLMQLSEEHLRPLVNQRGITPLETISGFAQFHSSYMSLIRDFSGKYNVDPLRLIVAVCERDKVDPTPELVESTAQQLKCEQSMITSASFGFNQYFGEEQRDDRKAA